MKLSRSFALLLAGLLAPTHARVGDSDFQRVMQANNCFSGNGFPKEKFIFKLNLLGKFEDSNGSFNPSCSSAKNCNMAIALSTKCRGKNGSDCDTSANTKIELVKSGTISSGDGFEVIDADGTDGEATLALPDPFEVYDSPCLDATNNNVDPECVEEATYSIFARVRGKGKIDARLCFTAETEDGTEVEYCQMKGVVSLIGAKGNKAVDISQQLLTVCADVDGDGTLDGVGLFDEFDYTDDGGLSTDDEDYFWSIDNTGARNAELRFYKVADLKDIDGCDFSGVTRGDACDDR